jgi:hypothetical protein
MVHLMVQEGRKQNGGHRRGRSETVSYFEEGFGYQPPNTERRVRHAVNTDRNQQDLRDLLPRSPHLSDLSLKRPCASATLGGGQRPRIPQALQDPPIPHSVDMDSEDTALLRLTDQDTMAVSSAPTHPDGRRGKKKKTGNKPRRR